MHSSKNILSKLFVAFGAVAFTVLFFEFFVFRFVFLPSDFPENEFVGGIIKYKPFQKGVYRIKKRHPSELQDKRQRLELRL